MDVATGINSTIYFASDALYALGNDGSLKWKIPSAWSWVSSAAIGEPGRIYFSRDAALCAADLSGKIVWERKMDGCGSFGPVIGPDGTIYAGEFQGSQSSPRIHAFTPDGTLKWTFETGPANLSTPAISDTGMLYFGGHSGNLYALGPDGKLRWTFATDRGVMSAPAVGPDGIIYCGCADGALYAVNSAGELKWKFQTKAAVSCSPAIDSDGNVYFTSGDHNLYSVDATGALKGTLPIKSGCGSPVIGPDGTIYLVDLDYVYAVRGLPGPAVGAWPMKRHDIQGTANVGAK